MIDKSFLKIYSTGSSIVIICLFIVVEISLINAAIVVDFQEPTLPVISKSQFLLFTNSKSLFGNHNSENPGKVSFIGLNTAQIQFFAINKLTLNLANHFNSIEKSNSNFSLKSFCCFSVIIELSSNFKLSGENIS
jgi:hypothetical protein